MSIGSKMNRIQYVFLLLLITSCVFDPADRIIHMKLPLFAACWALTIIDIFVAERRIILPWKMLIYICSVLSIPLLSIAYYTLFIGNAPYDGLQYLKSYLFITIIIVLIILNIDIVKPLCVILTVLSCMIIIIMLITYNNPQILLSLDVLGEYYGNLRFSRAQYGPLVMHRIFYTTSPMIAISIAYYVFMSITQAGKRKWFILLSAINIFAMILSGTRANIIMAVCLPLIIMVLFSKQNKLLLVAVIIGGFFISALVGDVVKAMFNPEEYSNLIKITHVYDYMRIFAEPTDLLFGQGVGSYYYWSGFGGTASITELTYFELFRNYGLIGGTVLLVLLLYPIFSIKLKYGASNTCILIGYAGYLVICSSNPLLFSSTGMLTLSAVIARLFLDHNQKEKNLTLIK